MRCFAYADESGNSGLRLFGDKQDTFWTGTLIAFFFDWIPNMPPSTGS